ncbi:hypothetical protein K9M79_00520 [Candidatus Woesearchaeota archaeon]|nr:hypothetical protein [Candidatus Woesearchaeota archaeon]
MKAIEIGKIMKSRIIFNLFVFFILIFSLFLTGCGGECETIGDCPNKECYTKRCTSDKKCEYDVKSDCCGNNKCEDGENKCTCGTDCGQCSGLVGEYLEMKCTSGNECVELIKDSIHKVVTDTKKLKDVEIDIVTEYRQPFNVDTDEIKLSIKSNQDLTTKTNVMVDSIQLVLIKSGARNVLYETDVGLGLYNKDSEIDFSLPLRFSSEEPETEYLTLAIAYSYDEFKSNSKSKVSDSIDIRLKEKITLVDPEGETCPSSCDDDNDCTKDICSEATGYKCKHEPQTDCASNGICETNENKCTASFDCGPCSGPYLSTMELECDQKICYKKVISSQTKTQTQEKSLSVCELDIRISYTNPFDGKNDNISLDISMLNANSIFVSPFVIKDIELYEGSILIGETVVEGNLAGPGKSINDISVPLNIPFEFDEMEKAISVKINYEYSKLQNQEKVGPFRDSFSIRLADKIVFANTGIIEGR